MKGATPIYTGISRKVIARLRQHMKGDTHNNASLAYKIAKEGFVFPQKMTAAEAMAYLPFRGRFDTVRTELSRNAESFTQPSVATRHHD
jgi:hypothetical protein